MAGIYEIRRPVEYYEADTNGYLSLPMIVNLAVLASKKQGDALEIGQAKTEAMGLGWVILQYDLQIKRRPRVNEMMRIQTTVGHYNPFFAQRGFKILTEDGDELVNITSLWTLIDMQKRHMVRLPLELVAGYGAEPTKKLDRIPAPHKIAADDHYEEHQYQVRYLDIDANRHVNNSIYFDWMADVLGPEFLQSHEVTRVNLKFENEVRLGHTVDSQVVLDGTHSYHRIKTGETVSAEAEFEWRTI